MEKHSKTKLYDFIFYFIMALISCVIFCIAIIFRCGEINDRRSLMEMSNTNHGATLEEFMTNVSREGDACYAMFDGNGSKLFEYMEDYYGLGMYEQPDWPDAEALFSLAEHAQVHTEVHWHPRLVPTSIIDDIYVSAQVKPGQLIIMEYDKTHYFTPGPDGWPEVTEMLNFQRWNSRNPFSSVLSRNYFEEMLKHFNIQHEIVPVE